MKTAVNVIIIDDEPPRAPNLWDVPAYGTEPALWVRPHKIRWLPTGEVVLMLVVSDSREFKATLEALNDHETTNGLKYSIAGNGEEVIASADQYRVFRENLTRMEDPRSSLVNLRPVMETIVCKIR